jgi:hypothetical protein
MRGDDNIRALMGEKFPSTSTTQSSVLGALVGHLENGYWAVDALGAPHVGERCEKSLISSLVDGIAELTQPRLQVHGKGTGEAREAKRFCLRS